MRKKSTLDTSEPALPTLPQDSRLRSRRISLLTTCAERASPRQIEVAYALNDKDRAARRGAMNDRIPDLPPQSARRYRQPRDHGSDLVRGPRPSHHVRYDTMCAVSVNTDKTSASASNLGVRDHDAGGGLLRPPSWRSDISVFQLPSSSPRSGVTMRG